MEPANDLLELYQNLTPSRFLTQEGAQMAEQLLFYRDKAVGQRLQLICLTTVRQLDAIHREAFDFMAAASFVHAFGESRQAIPAHQHLTTAKTTTINE